jgi:hypothetical protein
MVINALLSGMEDTSVYANRGVLDFLISHLPIQSAMNNDQENISLVEGALNLIPKKDFAVIKKVSTWILGHLDEEDQIDEHKDRSL